VVFADPSTVTGSIGVFGFKVDVKNLLGLLGVTVETNKRGAHADYMSLYRPWTEAELKLTTDKIRNLYGLFIDTVAAGRASRGLTVARVDEIGRGQVWTGAMAQPLGLVDKLGGLSAAIDEAVQRGRVPLGRDREPDIVVLPKTPSGLIRQLIGMADQAPPAPMHLLTPEARAALRLIAPLLLAGGSGFQARLPYDIELR
jgi:protease-4